MLATYNFHMGILSTSYSDMIYHSWGRYCLAAVMRFFLPWSHQKCWVTRRSVHYRAHWQSLWKSCVGWLKSNDWHDIIAVLNCNSWKMFHTISWMSWETTELASPSWHFLNPSQWTPQGPTCTVKYNLNKKSWRKIKSKAQLVMFFFSNECFSLDTASFTCERWLTM